MDVKVEVKCGRCGKKENRTLSLVEVQELQKKEDRKTVNAKELPTLINDTLSEGHPDIVVCVRKPGTDVYSVRGLSDLCDTPEAKRNKGCASRVENLLYDLFNIRPATPKKAAQKDGPKTSPEKRKK